MQSMACAGALGMSNSASSSFWRGGGGDTFVIESRCVKKSWNRLVQVVAQGAGGRGSRGRGDRNCQDRRNSGTLSKDYGRERFAREDYGRERFAREDYGLKDGAEAGRGATFRRGRGSGGSYRGRGGYGNNSSSYSGDYSGNRGSSGSGRGYRGNGRDYYRGARGSGYDGNMRGRGRGGGAGRYDELRRLAEKRMHDGAFEMLDEETGEKVIVWGVEDADSWPKPSAEDLKWKPTTVAMAGDVSEEGWYKAMEASMAGPSGAFSVKGVRQGGIYNDEEDDDDDEDEMDDMDYDDDDEDEDGDEFDDELRADLPEEPPFVRTVRPTRLRLFGRDFKQKEVLRSAASEEDRSTRTAESSRDGQESTSNGVPSSFVGVDNTTTAIADDDDVAQSWPPAGHLLTKNGSDVAPLGARTNTDDNSFSDDTSVEEALDQPWPPVGALFSGDDDSSASFPLNQDSSEVETASNGTTSRDTAWKDVERVVVTEQDWKQGGMNPGIVDIDEDEDDEYEGARRMANPKPRDGSVPVRSNLLDELRLQTTHKKLSSKSELGAKDENGARSHADFEDASDGVAVVKPRGFRDLKARTNYDPSLAAEFFSTKSFEDVSASEEVIAALRTLQLKKPSAIQAMAFKPVLEGQSCIVADQTGSGKTLAYLAPLVQMLRAEEGKSLTKKLNKMPRILVLVPTSELAVQVLNVCRAFSRGGAPFRSLVLTGGFKWKTQVESLTQGADVVVATPGRFLQHLEKGSLKLDNLKTVVLDEVDILYDDQEFTEVLQTLEQAASRRVQYVHVTATLPVDIHDSLLTRYPDAIPLMGPTLHRTAVGLQEVLVDCSGAEGEEKTPEKALLSKKAVLLQLVDQRPVSKTIIFCNKIETCRDVENALHRHDRSGTKLTVLPYHAALSQEARLESMQRFLESQPSKSLFLVCTDRASRGLDSFDVEHVVLFDYPRDPSEYVRRVGRTARGAGGTGTVFVFALGKQVAMARRIMARNEKGRPVHDIPGSAYET